MEAPRAPLLPLVASGLAAFRRARSCRVRLEMRGTGSKAIRSRRDLNPRYRRESGMAKRNSKKFGRTGWRSRSSKKHLIVSPVFYDSELPCSVFELFEATVEGSLFRAERKRIYNDLERTDDTVSR